MAAEAMGINLAKHKRMAFCISSFFAGVGGGLFRHVRQPGPSQDLHHSMTYEILLIVVIGGIGPSPAAASRHFCMWPPASGGCGSWTPA